MPRGGTIRRCCLERERYADTRYRPTTPLISMVSLLAKHQVEPVAAWGHAAHTRL
jgi:hypothetical protein